ncbi:HAD family hydrolase [Vibrio sp. JPW-9-11-11]|uniref:HAD family hydrolase n=1 Tax=Vibrio sp. JPW-9-11-11 TaxID=1416532 RepID=UPI001594888F|nr:HAD family hydrolase [Vibrio sp. JPW-9-11-11]NVD08899.1 HAD family hydrolase [Vibrio sp. JPW-9-11-11]
MSYVPLAVEHIKAIVFDLDNTLVTSDMNFAWLREQIGCPHDNDLLSFVEQIKCDITAKRAQQMILDHEIQDAESSEPMPGCHSLLKFIDQNQLHTAVITRNCAHAAQQKIRHNQLAIDRVISREHFPPKPAPDALISLAQEWRIQPHQMMYVGDYVYDLQAAFNADMPSCLVTHGKASPFHHQASLVVDHLHDLERWIAQHQR